MKKAFSLVVSACITLAATAQKNNVFVKAAIPGIPAGEWIYYNGMNGNVDTGTRMLTPAGAPPDGGFGEDQHDGIAGFGNGTMNTPPLIEAADTAPFFHNHSAKTLEDAIRFYGSDTFAQSPAGNGNPFDMSADDVNAIGAFLRALSAMEPSGRFGSACLSRSRRRPRACSPRAMA